MEAEVDSEMAYYNKYKHHHKGKNPWLNLFVSVKVKKKGWP